MKMPEMDGYKNADVIIIAQQLMHLQMTVKKPKRPDATIISRNRLVKRY
jgi:hypothetical protein